MFALRVIAARSPACSIQRCLFSSVSPSDLFTKYQDLAKSASLALESKRALEAAKQADVVDKVKNKKRNKSVASDDSGMLTPKKKRKKDDNRDLRKSEAKKSPEMLDPPLPTKKDEKFDPLSHKNFWMKPHHALDTLWRE